MPTRLSHPPARINYRAPRAVGRAEHLLAARTGRTPGSAHQHLLTLRRDVEVAVGALIDAGQPERAVWLASPLMARLEAGADAGTLDEAAIAEQEADGAEDVRWEEYRAGGETRAGFRLYERATHRLIARLLAKLAVGRRHHELTP